MPEYQLLLSCHTLEVSTTEVFTMDYTYVFAYCVSILCDIYIVGNWHAEAVEEFEEEECFYAIWYIGHPLASR